MQSKGLEKTAAVPGLSLGFDLTALLKSNDIDSRVQRHLVRVYSTLAVAVFAASVGVLLDISISVAGYTTAALVLGLLVALFALPKKNVGQRFTVLLSLAVCWGVNLGGLVHYALATDPEVVGVAFVGTTVIFGCFTLSALVERRRMYLYMGAFFSSAILCLLLVGLVNIFVQSAAIYSLELYGGLLIFCFYVLFDTQLIVEKASLGDDDFVAHAFELFLDFVNLFVRILTILLRKREGRDDSAA
ncbi:hypothetical protein ACHHYP_04098 [Achlya hypogyna]|uniref:Bax inhibitor 1 n=1 Tax=Achlya hypogyna TaxID=1202772 RepID=A0A1V9Z2P6_ACHHY|nr:hypothetical protein ACHHYP_04098 [Achlya hypogyna]